MKNWFFYNYLGRAKKIQSKLDYEIVIRLSQSLIEDFRADDTTRSSCLTVALKPSNTWYGAFG